MKKFFIILVFCNLFASSILSQTDEYSAPINWKTYSISEHEISFHLPKLPTVVWNISSCTQENTKNYYAYASDVIYGLRVITKSDDEVPSYCKVKRKFSQESFENRLKEFKDSGIFKNQLENSVEEKFEVNGKTGIIFKANNSVYLFVNDFENNR